MPVTATRSIAASASSPRSAPGVPSACAKSRTNARRVATTAVLVIGLALAALCTAGAASAHVTVSAPGVTVGATDAAIIFRVPTESAGASTVEVRVQLPTDTPLAGVLVAPIPGWTAKITNLELPTPIKTDDGEITEVVSEIDWKADAAAAIKPGSYGEFRIIAGSLPDASTLTFKAIQVYSDRKQVAWIEVPAAGSTAEPDHPAPTLTLAPATGATSATGSAASSPAAKAGSDSAPAAATGASKGAAATGIVLGAGGLMLGAIALALTLLRGRRAGGTPPRS